MLFNNRCFVYSPSDKKKSVVALSSDAELSEIRIRPFLSALLARDVIASFQFADRKMNLLGCLKTARFTHVWCHRNVSYAQYRFLKSHPNVPLIYDIDDLLTSVPEFVMKRRPNTVWRIKWCLNRADFVTTTNEQLAGDLRSGALLTKDPIILKNGHTGFLPPVQIGLKKQIVWTSGDFPFVLMDYPHFMNDLANIANRHDYEMIFIGRFDPECGVPFKKYRYIPRLDFDSYREFLKFSAGAIGIAPLPSRLPAAAQKFFDAKSDIKLLNYLSAGLVPICTSTTPYSASDLFIPDLAAPDASGLLDRLETCIANHASAIEDVGKKNHATTGLIKREFTALSKVLDPIFQK
ncbi:MAG: hypothetical protein K2X60_07935 [Xanthobacteraceae bacterium]|nr:hypothetical protein [Xanthobacteraceae bacterium]